MSNRVARIVGLLTLAAVCGCASNKPLTSQSVTYRTGSLLLIPASESSQPGFGPSQSVSQDDLTRTGRLDVASALKALVPRAH